MKTFATIVILLLTYGMGICQTFVPKTNTKNFCTKYTGFVVNYSVYAANDVKKDKPVSYENFPIVYTWKWEATDQYTLWLNLECVWNGKKKDYVSGGFALSMIPSSKEWKYKFKNSDYGGKIFLYRKTLDQTIWTEAHMIWLNPENQIDFIKDLALAMKDYGATLTEKTD